MESFATGSVDLVDGFRAADRAGPRYQLIGPLRVRDGVGGPAISARKMEILLAVLLIRSGQILTVDQLITEIWGEHAPRRAVATVQVYVSQLRKFLRRSSAGNSPIVTRPSGYVLTVAPGELDLHQLQDLVRHSRTLFRERRYPEAVTALEDALGLWRGPVLCGLRDSPTISGFATWLEEIRLECVELAVESNLALGGHLDLIGGLYSLITEYPLREGLYRHLMLALYRADRRADALRVYQSARETLHAELGLEPCRALSDMQHAILVSDPRLDLPASVDRSLW